MIPIFSPNGVDTSLVVPVYIGVLFAFFMTERYGWVFSGLVIPGYMAPIASNYPLSALAIVVESVVTYLIVRGCFEGAWRHRAHTPPFGRERFLGIVLVGVSVRLVFEEGCVPFIVEHVFGGGAAALIDSRQMGAIGLVIVPLMANIMWRPGVSRGLLQVSALTLATGATMHWVVQPLTNFSFSRMEVLYDDVALDFAKSARTQIMLGVGCFVAAVLNRREGWDFSGILIPPLIAASLYQPVRLLSTLGETLAIVGLARALLWLPPFQRLVIAGPRVTLYLLTVAIFLKWILGWVLWWRLPHWVATDFFGFGYLLSTLLAIKVWGKGMRVSFFPTVYVSVFIFGVGSATSVVLQELLPRQDLTAPQRLEHSVVVRLDARELLCRDWSFQWDDAWSLDQGYEFDEAVAQLIRARVRGEGALAALLEHLQDKLPATTVELMGGGTYWVLADPRGSERLFFLSLQRDSAQTQPWVVVEGGENPVASLAAASALFSALQPRGVLLLAPRSGEMSAEALQPILRRGGDLRVLQIKGVEHGSTLHCSGALPEAHVLQLLQQRGGIEASLEPALLLGVPTATLHIDLPSALALWGEPALDPLTSNFRQQLPEWLQNTGQRVPRSRLLPLLVRELIDGHGRHRAAHLAQLAPLARVIGAELYWGNPLVGDPWLALTLPPLQGSSSSTPEVFVVRTRSTGVSPYLHVEVVDPRRYRGTTLAGCQIYDKSDATLLTFGNGDRSPQTLLHTVHCAAVEGALARGQAVPRTLQLRSARIEGEYGEDYDGRWVSLDDIRLGAQQPVPAETAAKLLEEQGWLIESTPLAEAARQSLEGTLQARYRRFLRVGSLSGLWINTAVMPQQPSLSVEQEPQLSAVFRREHCDPGEVPFLEAWGRWQTVQGNAASASQWWTLLRLHQRYGSLNDLRDGLRGAREDGWRARLFRQPTLADARGQLYLCFDRGEQLAVLRVSAAAWRRSGGHHPVDLVDFCALERPYCFAVRREP